MVPRMVAVVAQHPEVTEAAGVEDAIEHCDVKINEILKQGQPASHYQDSSRPCRPASGN